MKRTSLPIYTRIFRHSNWVLHKTFHGECTVASLSFLAQLKQMNGQQNCYSHHIFTNANAQSMQMNKLWRQWIWIEKQLNNWPTDSISAAKLANDNEKMPTLTLYHVCDRLLKWKIFAFTLTAFGFTILGRFRKVYLRDIVSFCMMC